jgi:hypothetical protein
MLSPVSVASTATPLLSPNATPVGGVPLQDPLLAYGEPLQAPRTHASVPVSLGLAFEESGPTEIHGSDAEEERDPGGTSGGVAQTPPAKRVYLCGLCGQPKKGHTCSLLLQGAPKTKGKEPDESQGGDSKDESQGGDSQRIAGAASNSPRGGDPARKTLLERHKKLKAFFAEQDAAEKKQEAQYIDFWFVHMEAYKLKVTLGLDPAAAIQKWRCRMERQKAQERVEEAWFTQVTEVWLSKPRYQ